MSAGSASTGLSITNPLVLYRTLLATNKIQPDPAQHRLALQLQKLYFRLKDYSPELEYRHRLDEISKSLSRTQHVSQQGQRVSVGARPGFLSSLLRTGSTGGPSLSLTRTMPIHDSALAIDSPQGMLLYGEVGRGKSMLLDLLYNSLPSSKKRRWHFNTFMLDIFRRLELSRIERADLNADFQHEHVIVTLAKDSIANSPILFLDEFQMPDRTASKLLNGFMTSFFHLGGVLVASSNRMPDELAKASGIDFQSDRSRSAASMFGWGIKRMSDGQKAARSDFGLFLEVLKARCEVWQMEGERDWRREMDLDWGDDSVGPVGPVGHDGPNERMLPGQSPGNVAGLEKSIDSTSIAPSSQLENSSSSSSSDTPTYYHISTPSSSLADPLASDIDRLNPSGAWQPKTLTIYSRPLDLTHTNDGILLATFDDLCAAPLGPADYTSLCSHFHTLIITGVPVLTMSLKNEARRFITLLDALYEARCRLLIEAAAPPDKLFFPETQTRTQTGGSGGACEVVIEAGDSIESETYAEIYQDSTAPFRPNVSLYEEGGAADAALVTPSSRFRSVLADEDADFGPTYGNGRGHGASSNDLAAIERQQSVQQGIGPDFTNISELTGQDEMFAYKRARSRLWEMCGRRWWQERCSGAPEEWWTPIQPHSRFWEGPRKRQSTGSAAEDHHVKTKTETETSLEWTHDRRRNKIDDLYNTDQNNTRPEPEPSLKSGKEQPPRFGLWHAWGLSEWGQKGSGRAKELFLKRQQQQQQQSRNKNGRDGK